MDVDELIQCPYNKSHSILSSRMQFHLMKCRQQYPDMPKVTCPYNSTHVVSKVELELHLATCSDRIVIDSYIYVMGPDPDVPKPSVSKIESLAITGEEMWDDDPPKNVLETVQESCKSRLALQTVVGVSKSERKAFRYQQRLKAAYLTNTPVSRTNELDQPGPSGVGKRETEEKSRASKNANDFCQPGTSSAWRKQTEEKPKPNNNVNERSRTYSSDSDQSGGDEQAKQTTTRNAAGAQQALRRNSNNPWGTSNSTVLNNENKAQRNEDDVLRSLGNLSIEPAAGTSKKVVRNLTNPWHSIMIPSTSSELVDNFEFPGLPVTVRRQKGKAPNRNQ